VTAVGSGAGLAWIGLVVDDVVALATSLVRDFGLTRVDMPADGSAAVPVFPVGATALALFPPGHPMVGGEARPGVHHVALGAPDLPAAAARVRAAGIPVVDPEPEPALARGGRLLLAPGATAGLRTYLAEPLDLPPAAAGPVERVDHLGVASADNAAAIEVFAHRLGFPLESTQTDLEVRIPLETFTSDKYGIVHHARPPEALGGLRVAFVTVGDCELEFLQDLDPGEAAPAERGGAGTTRRDQGAIARFVAGRGPGLHHVALKVRDIDGLLADLARAGHRLLDPVGRPGSRRARIGFLHPRSLQGVLVHLVERTEG
jgi:catechol 2,3-dioxygenase-like lactoylglutathione lyase family enzyme